MKTKPSKTEAIKKIGEFFLDIGNKNPKQVKKIKNLAMSFNIPLKTRRKTFCKRCLAPYKSPKIRIKNNFKIMTCDKCGFVSNDSVGCYDE